MGMAFPLGKQGKRKKNLLVDLKAYTGPFDCSAMLLGLVAKLSRKWRARLRPQSALTVCPDLYL
jgi:hypothetical protein